MFNGVIALSGAVVVYHVYTVLYYRALNKKIPCKK